MNKYSMELDIDTGLYRIIALKDFGPVKKGDIGGLISAEKNLSQAPDDAWVFSNARVSDDARVSDYARVSGEAQVSGKAWVYGNARVSGNAWVSDKAWVYGEAQVSGNAWVYGEAWVSGNAQVSDKAQVSGEAWVSGDARVSDKAWVSGNARVYGEALVYGEAQVSGEARVQSMTIEELSIVSEGTILVYKKLRDGIAILEIPKNAKRVGGICGRKCRAEYAKVIRIEKDGKEIKKSVDLYSGELEYVSGKTVKPNSFNSNPRIECSTGIHFFLTRTEAERFNM